jgi:hypothetical protein
VGLFTDGSVRHFAVWNDVITRQQEWYSNGSPKIAIHRDDSANVIEKKVWTEDGRPESLVNFRDGQLAGLLCKNGAGMGESCMRQCLRRAVKKCD